MVCNKKRQLNKLEKPSISEVSVVGAGANRLEKWDIIKSENASEIKEFLIKAYDTFSEIIAERSEYKISSALWELFTYTLEDKLYELKWEDNMEKEEKIVELQGLFEEFLQNFSTNPLIKSEDAKNILEVINKSKENKDETSNEIKKEEKMSKMEEFKKAIKDALAEIMPKEESELEKQISEKEVELTKAQEAVSQKEAEIAELAKAKEEAEAKIAEIEKQAKEEAERLEKEAIEKAETIRKEELVSLVKEKMSFVDGTPEEVAEKLFAIEKACGEDNKESFTLLLSALEKKSEKIESLMEESGSEGQEADLTKSKEEIAFKEIAKIQAERKVSQTEAFSILEKEKPELLSIEEENIEE